MSSSAKPSFARKMYRTDELLVRECLLGTESAWSELIEKYKKLIYSIPVKSGFSTEDTNEIFQSVWYTALRDLPQLREPKAIAAWLIRLTVRKCASFRDKHLVYTDIDPDAVLETTKLPDDLAQQLEREQILREAIGETSPECARLIHLLFFENPPMSYDQAAQALNLAKGSIGATRMRCLEKLRRALEKKGFAD